MTSSDRPHPQPTPESEGIPDHADDDSTAFTEADRPRFRDSPPPLPADRPQAIDERGLTAEEQRQRESHDAHLAREEPDPALAADPAAEYGRVDTSDTATTGEGRSAEEEAMREVSEDRSGPQP